jgi:putative transposase
MYAFKRLSEVREITDNWIREYNEERPHDSLGDLIPREYLMANSKQENSKSAWAKFRGL